MFSLFRKKADKPQGEAERMVDELIASSKKQVYSTDLLKDAAYTKIKATSLELQAQVVVHIAQWLQNHDHILWRNGWWNMHQALIDLLGTKLPFDEDELLQLLDWSISQRSNYLRQAPTMTGVVENYLKTNPLTDELSYKIQTLAAVVDKGGSASQEKRRAQRLRRLAGYIAVELPIVRGETWANAAIEEIGQAGAEKQAAWTALLQHCLMVSGSAPSGKWLNEASKQVEKIGAAEFRAALLRWFPLVDRLPDPPLMRMNRFEPDPNQVLKPVNAELLKGLAWASSRNADQEMARALAALALSAYRKVPGYGPRAAKVGNGCIWALGNLPGMDGLAQLSILKIKVRQNRAQALIAGALEAAAQRNGMTAEEVVEMCVPTYGLEEVGLRIDELDEIRSEVWVDGSSVEQTWLRADGKKLAAAPKAVKDEFKEDLHEIQQAIKDLRKMLPAQRERLESLYLAQNRWSLPVWMERYLNHPLVGTLARRLIWKFSQGDRAASGAWLDGEIVGRDGQPIEWLSDETTVDLWHPLHVDPQVVLEWRQWLAAHEIQQPFKQAHREVYLLTDAELATRVYSNRFAAHVLRQHQFNALCLARSWKNSLRLMVDAEVPPATRLLPQWGLRAEFWIEALGDTYGTDTNDSGTYLYVGTDQVRFYPVMARENYAHVSGGGYHTGHWRGGEPAAPLLLQDIPPLVFSEILRDVDLFVGVASVGNDPTWSDGGPQGRYLDYWHSYSFGELGETAKTRRAVLETLLPRLKIGPRCSLRDKFLVVRGDIRTYKIHLGSGNILMEPNDRYLCIVPQQGGAQRSERLFLPFEGDTVLAVILSKAFLLAEDKKITDPTITRQIR